MSIRFDLNGNVLLTHPENATKILKELDDTGTDEQRKCVRGMDVFDNRFVVFASEVDLDTAITILQSILKLQSDDQPYFTIWSENAYDLNQSVLFVLRDRYTEKSVEELSCYYAEREIR